MSRKNRRAKKAVSIADPPTGKKTQAALANTIKEPVPRDANGRTRYRRLHPLESMRRAGTITPRQHDAGMELSKLYEATLTGPPAINENPVQSSPDHAAIITGKIERMWRFSMAIASIPTSLRPAVDHVCCEGRYMRDGLSRNQVEYLRHLTWLQVSLDMVAKGMRI